MNFPGNLLPQEGERMFGLLASLFVTYKSLNQFVQESGFNPVTPRIRTPTPPHPSPAPKTSPIYQKTPVISRLFYVQSFPPLPSRLTKPGWLAFRQIQRISEQKHFKGLQMMASHHQGQSRAGHLIDVMPLGARYRLPWRLPMSLWCLQEIFTSGVAMVIYVHPGVISKRVWKPEATHECIWGIGTENNSGLTTWCAAKKQQMIAAPKMLLWSPEGNSIREDYG